jgi:hypothetical protein
MYRCKYQECVPGIKNFKIYLREIYEFENESYVLLGNVSEFNEKWQDLKIETLLLIWLYRPIFGKTLKKLMLMHLSQVVSTRNVPLSDEPISLRHE